MTHFEDGPAKGQTLMLNRAPIFLRVTRDSKGKFDALNQVYDTPNPDETIWAYELIDVPGAAFIDGPKLHQLVRIANYRMVTDQPSEAQMRDNTAWERWRRERFATKKVPAFYLEKIG